MFQVIRRQQFLYFKIFDLGAFDVVWVMNYWVNVLIRPAVATKPTIFDLCVFMNAIAIGYCIFKVNGDLLLRVLQKLIQNILHY